jgi:Ca-activated chloride channel family protein
MRIGRTWLVALALPLVACTGAASSPPVVPEAPPPAATPATPVATTVAASVETPSAAALTPATPEARASIEILPLRAAVSAKKPDEISVRVRVAGLPLADAKRPPINVAIVIDASGSMQGAGIEASKKASAALVDQLHDGDAISIVTFGSKAKIAFEASRVSAKSRESAKAAIAAIEANGTTDMAGGLRMGLDQAKALFDPAGINRVVLVGDGVPNDPVPLAPLADQANAAHIPITSLGLGPEFDETQMAMLAQRSGGSFRFVADSDKVAAVFHDEIERMERVAAKGAWVELTPGPGVDIVEAIGMTAGRDGKKLRIGLGDLVEGKPRDVVVDVKLTGHPEGARVELMDAVVHFLPPAGGAERTAAEFAALESTSNAEALKAINADLDHEVVRLRVADAIVKAMASARGGDVRGAQKILDAASKLATDGAKRFDDASLGARVKEIRDLKKTIPSLAPPVFSPAVVGSGGMMKRPMPMLESAAPAMSPAASLGMKRAHGAAMDALQGE